MTSEEQFEVFQARHNTNPSQPNPYNPVGWIASLKNEVLKKEQERSWINSLRLAKMLVSAACNPNLDIPEKIRSTFETWVSNPFDCDNPYDVFDYRAGGRVSSGKEWVDTIGGITFFIW